MPLRLRLQPAKVGLRVGQERRGGLSITSRSPICHVPAVHRWTHRAMPASKSNNVKYRAVPCPHPPLSLGDSQSKTFGNSQTHLEPLYRIASLM